jgi:hypothetical protein
MNQPGLRLFRQSIKNEQEKTKFSLARLCFVVIVP